MNTLALDHVNKRAEFVMSFTIPFKAVEGMKKFSGLHIL